MTTKASNPVQMWLNIGAGVIMAAVGFLAFDAGKNQVKTATILDALVPRVERLEQLHDDGNGTMNELRERLATLEARLHQLEKR